MNKIKMEKNAKPIHALQKLNVLFNITMETIIIIRFIKVPINKLLN